MARKRRSGKIVGVILAAFVVLIVVVIVVTSGWNPSRKGHPRREFGKIYRAEDGHFYTRSHGSAGFEDWMYNGGDAGRVYGPTSFSNGSWSRVSTIPSRLLPTTKMVAEENGRPTSEVEEEYAATESEEITASTTESEAEDMDLASDSGSDSGGESGSSDSGGDAGGGAGGGGSD